MIIKKLYMFLIGTIDASVEGFFIEKFINKCRENNVLFLSLKKQNSSMLKIKIKCDDIDLVMHIANEMGCRIIVNKKKGLPDIKFRYKQRKIFVIAFIVITFFLLLCTRFIWNVEVNGLDNINEEDILELLKEYGFEVGKLKKKYDLEDIKNQIRLRRDDISWIGIDINGTNVEVNIVEATKKTEINSKQGSCNIISNKNAIISKITVRNGTARVNVGDEVQVGDLLVEGIMEGKYTDPRMVVSDADIYAISYYSKERFEPYIQEKMQVTGNVETSSEIYFNNFKIIFNKTLPKFEKYDTIRTYKRVKIFEKYYLPIKIVNTVNSEVIKKYNNYSEEELIQKIETELKEELDNEIDFSNSINSSYDSNYEIQDERSDSEDNIFS